MEFLRFIFSSFWVWLGFGALIAWTLTGISQIVKNCHKSGRTIKAYQWIGGRWTIEVKNATEADVATALKKTEDSQNGTR